MNSLYETAKFWNNLGVATIPVYYKSKQPKIRWIEYTNRLPTDNEISNWYAARYSNIAVIAGWNNLTVIDFDDMAAFTNWKQWAEESSTTAQKALRFSRMSLSARGVHIYTFCCESFNLKLPGIDILADRKYALIPPSTHPSGKQYTLQNDRLPVRIDSIRELFPASIIEPAIEKAAAPYTEPHHNSTVPVSYDPWQAACGNQQSSTIIPLIKSHYRIQDFFPDAQFSGGNGRWMLARCPFHPDHNPSLSIDTEAQTCKCLSSHNCTPLPLDVIGLYARLHHISTSEAITHLRRSL